MSLWKKIVKFFTNGELVDEMEYTYSVDRLVKEHRDAGCTHPEICGGPPRITSGPFGISMDVYERYTVPCVKRQKVYDTCRQLFEEQNKKKKKKENKK